MALSYIVMLAGGAVLLAVVLAVVVALVIHSSQ